MNWDVINWFWAILNSIATYAILCYFLYIHKIAHSVVSDLNKQQELHSDSIERIDKDLTRLKVTVSTYFHKKEDS